VVADPDLPEHALGVLQPDGTRTGAWGNQLAEHYTVAWFDRWLKQPGEAGYATADARLTDDAALADRLSFYYCTSRAMDARDGRSLDQGDVRGSVLNPAPAFDATRDGDRLVVQSRFDAPVEIRAARLDATRGGEVSRPDGGRVVAAQKAGQSVLEFDPPLVLGPDEAVALAGAGTTAIRELVGETGPCPRVVTAQVQGPRQITTGTTSGAADLPGAGAGEELRGRLPATGGTASAALAALLLLVSAAGLARRRASAGYPDRC
jgi:hypothetical protein